MDCENEVVVAKRSRNERLHGPGYAKALRLLVDGERTWRDMAAALNVNRNTSAKVLHGFHRQGLAHIVRYDGLKFGRRVTWTPVYAYGPGPEIISPSIRKKAAATPVELLTFCQTVLALQSDSWHKLGLSRHVGASTRSTSVAIESLRALRLVVIDDWFIRPKAGAGHPLYAWGVDGVDAVKPKPMSRRKLWRRNNQVRSDRRREQRLLRAMVCASAIDRRTACAKESA